jgi:hypothetical protein
MKRANIFAVTIIFAILAMLASSASVEAVGLLGTKDSFKIFVDFEPGKELSYVYTLTTTISDTIDYEFFVNGPEGLEDIVTFNPPSLNEIGPADSPQFEVNIKLPDELGPPGQHIVKFGVVEGIEGKDGMFARTAVQIPIIIRVLYPGKYAKASLTASDVSEGDPVPFLVNVENWGTENIARASATIEVYDVDGRHVTTLFTDEKPVLSASSAQLTATMNMPGLDPGEYYAEALVNWDGGTLDASDTFRIGTVSVKILEYTKSFRKDEISPFDIMVESEWNNMLNDVYATVAIDFDNGVELQTPTTSLQAWEQKALRTYWDTSDVPVGEYNARLTVYYEGDKKAESIMIRVSDASGARGRDVLGIDNYSLLLLVIAILIALILILVYKGRRRQPAKRKARGRG